MSHEDLIEYCDLDFEFCGSQQFATVIFDREEDDEKCRITIVRDGTVRQFTGDNKYNPSLRRRSTCVYVREEGSYKTIKICTIQHKGNTLVNVLEVPYEERRYLFQKEIKL